MTAPHGVLVVDKPRGPSSHDVVAQARRLYGTRAVGHAGTLDPMASGVLVLVLGEATKLAGYLTQEHKTYRAEVTFGVGTDSLDAAGEVLERVELQSGWLDRAALDRALARERSRTEQQPPAVSAIHVAGQRAYTLFRRGETPVLQPRPVNVLKLELLSQRHDRLEIELTVSKGYYVRALARDLGAALSTPACLSALRRLASGGFTLDHAATWPAAEPPELLTPAAAARLCLPSAQLTEAGAARAGHGQRLLEEHFESPPAALPENPAAWFAPDGRLVAIGTLRDETYVVLRGFNSP